MKKREAILIYPHQLFKSHPVLKVGRQVFLIEDEHFFSAFRFHKQKLVLHRASLQAYARRLENRYRLTYVPHDQSDCGDMSALLRKAGVQQIHAASLCDNELSAKVQQIAERIGAEWIEHPTPMFITPHQRLQEWFGRRKHLHMASFYQVQRKTLGVLMEDDGPAGGKWSFDAENRKRLPRNIVVPPLSVVKRNPLISKAIEYVNKQFPDHPGRAEDFLYPVTHRQAEKWLRDFLQRRLADFGAYEDAMSQHHTFLFHSVLTPMLNIGLLTPRQVLDKVLGFHESNDVPLASLEGFIRQVIGWREFMWGVYDAVGRTQRQGNFWNCQNSLPGKFYEGNTGILPLDTVIKRVLKHAYCHHIERLMILGNFMLLCEIHPDEVYRWFMELFIDSYDWVMVPNVYGMSQYADGGQMTTKPYISSSNYIL
ncbi:MAG: cryptochrome/photolyase family protein, partial [Planctomycetota bacterium]